MFRATGLVLILLTVPALCQEKEKEKTYTPSVLLKTWQKKRQKVAIAAQSGNAMAKEKAQKELDTFMAGQSDKKVEGNAIVQQVGKTKKDGIVIVEVGIGTTGSGIVYRCQCAKSDFLATLKRGRVVKVSGTVESFKYASTKIIGKGAGARPVKEGDDTIVLKDCTLSKKK
jgi:hypothetical protein